MRHLALAIIVALAGLVVAQPSIASADSHEPDRVYFEETGQYVSGEFLDFWWEYGGIQTFGYPISPEITEDGMTVQYFERHVLEWHPDNPENHQVLLRRLGAEAADERGLRDHEAFDYVDEADVGRYFEPTGQVMAFGFLDYCENNGGLRIFGYPISGEFEYNGLNVQFTERAIFEWHPDNPAEWRILFERLGAEAADRNNVDRSPQAHDGDTPHYHPDLWAPPEPDPEPVEPAPGVTPPAGAPTGDARWIEVDLTNQMMRAWEYDEVVYSAVVSTGRSAVPTLTGQWEIYAMLRYDDMSGTTPDQGDYDLRDVPYVMYYDRGYGLHGTYWHNNFGTPMSAGCVNLTVEDARWLFNWASIGTTVHVHGSTPTW